MRLKKSLIIVFSMIIFSAVLIGAKPKKAMSPRSPIVIGEVMEVQKGEDDSIRITVSGYIKGKEVHKITVVGIIDGETNIINSSKDSKDDILIEKGDTVYMRVNEAMTKSNPPQTIVKRIFITKNK